MFGPQQTYRCRVSAKRPRCESIHLDTTSEYVNASDAGISVGQVSMRGLDVMPSLSLGAELVADELQGMDQHEHSLLQFI
jgi:hypothetical protein